MPSSSPPPPPLSAGSSLPPAVPAVPAVNAAAASSRNNKKSSATANKSKATTSASSKASSASSSGVTSPAARLSPPHSPRLLEPALTSASTASSPTASTSSANSSGSGSGRGRRLTAGGAGPGGGSVQARRSVMSLGLGAEYANMNELTSPVLAHSPVHSAPGSRERALSTTAAAGRTAGDEKSPTLQYSTIPTGGGGSGSGGTSRRASVQFADPTSPNNAAARRPSVTHLASFLAGVQHHTRVRSPGPSGGRGVSRSASRSVSRAGSVSRAASVVSRRRRRRRRSASGESVLSSEGGAFEFDDDEDEGEASDGERDEEDSEGERGAEEQDEEDWRSRLMRATQAGGGPPPTSYGYYDDDQPEPKEFNWFPPVGGGDGGVGGTGGPASSWFRSPSVQQRRAPSVASSSVSRASSIHSVTRRSSRRNSVAASTTGTTGPTSPHPALHELVRENTTGGVVPSENVAIPGSGPSSAGATSAASEWEATNETYKPSVLTTPRTRRATSPASVLSEEPFLDSEPNSPRSPARLMHRTKTYDSYASSSRDDFSDLDGGDEPMNDLANVDVFDEGERVGVGVWLEGRGGYVRDCFAGKVDRDGKAPGNGLDGPKQLEVERRLGEGTYAIVYLVREVLHDPDTTLDGDDDDVLSPIDPLASFEFDDTDSQHRPRLHSWASDTWTPPPKPTYGQYFALKCLCKKNLTEDLIEVQRNEAFLHRALPKHENIVQMYGAYETDDWLFLVLEYAGGRDAFYWLLEAQEHGTEELYSRAASPAGDFDGDPDDSALSRTITADTPAHLLVDETPPSPSLLSAAMGDQLLSRKRLRLISRMFGQMCAAVQACHDVGISHRDIKPENFIVIDGKDDRGAKTNSAASAKQGVVIKITDWGLGTMQEYCDDFDCGSKPYMAYECRNNLRPSYDPRQADVWSLGLVFLNLLYHRNPWADPSLDDPDFAEYVDDPIGFMQNRFEGMSDEVAHYLANNVFCDVLEIVDGKQRRRVSAGEFGRWASRLVTMMGEGQLGPNERPHITSADSYSVFEFSPVTTMPVTIAGGPPSASLLSQFAPSTVKANSSILDDLPNDLRSELPTVPEVPDMSFTSSTPIRPSYISSPTALSEDGDSLPSPTFPSPAVAPRTAQTSPNGIAKPLPWSSPTLPAQNGVSPPTLSPAATVPSSPHLPPASGISLLAARRPTLLDAHADSAMSNTSTVLAPSGPASPDEDAPSATVPSSTSEADAARSGDDSPPVQQDKDEQEEGADGAKTPGEKEKASKSKRRKRGARKEKRAARQAERENGVGSGSGAASPVASPRSGKLPTVDESRAHDHVLEDLAAASQELARELSSTRSGSSHRSSRPRPVPGSRSLGTQSTSAIPTLMHEPPTPGPGKRGGGMFGRLKTLVNEGNSDLEAFKRRVDERDTAIGAKADTCSAPAQMQGGRVPRGKYDSPFSSHGSIGTASWGSIQEGDEDAARGRAHDHWSSAQSRRDRLADRRGHRTAATGASASNDFSPSASSTTRGNPSFTFESSASRMTTPLSSFGSVGSPMASSAATVRDWRSTSPAIVDKNASTSRGRQEATTPAPVRPKLRDASTDTSDLVVKKSVAVEVSVPPRAVSASPLPTASPAKSASPSTVSAPPLSASATPPPPTVAPSPTTRPNKLSKMFGSISVFNRSQASAS
ncbi:hypothetical protein JCM10908_002203 [Rhodotorula pacifica]|uniref:uncharacterized protein n=1 Tax=Rhodotorula pacifica TaxID=1495444 RepID=UPI003182536F